MHSQWKLYGLIDVTLFIGVLFVCLTTAQSAAAEHRNNDLIVSCVCVCKYIQYLYAIAIKWAIPATVPLSEPLQIEWFNFKNEVLSDPDHIASNRKHFDCTIQVNDV